MLYVLCLLRICGRIGRCESVGKIHGDDLLSYARGVGVAIAVFDAESGETGRI